MYIGMKDLKSIHRHVKTVNGLELTNKQMDELRNLVSTAKDKELAPNKELGNYIIKQCVNVHKAGSITTTVTVALNA